MRFITTILVALLLGSVAHGEQMLREITWDKVKPEAGEVIAASGDTPAQLRVASTGSQPLTVRLITIEKPGITGITYAVTGRIRYEGVEGAGYLEMWNVFPNGGRYFTKTLGDGPLAPIAGSSKWRDFVLPFSTQGTSQKPSSIEINLVLPGKGTVYLGPLKLVEPAPGVFSTAPRGIRILSVLGPIAGIFSVFVGLFAVVTVLLVLRGKARRFVLAMWFIFMGVGIAFLIVAQMFREPPFVYYPLLLTGIIHTALASLAVILIRKQYERRELRRMSALDADLDARKK